MDETDYVIVVHGTWSADGSANPWYQEDTSDSENFAAQLNDHLDRAGIGRCVGRPLSGEPIRFTWSGSNKHSDRLAAGRTLFDLLLKIEKTDPTARFHFVAHSHGGNVVLTAVQHYIDHQRRTARNLLRSRRFREDPTSAIPSTAVHCVETSQSVQAILETLSRPPRERRSAWDFSDQWLQSRPINRIGRLVFLGTPFVWKFWRRDWWKPSAILGHFIDLLITFPALAIGAYCFILFYWLFYWAGGSYLGSSPRVPVLTIPANWPSWVFVLIGGAGLLLSRLYRPGQSLLRSFTGIVGGIIGCFCYIALVLSILGGGRAIYLSPEYAPEINPMLWHWGLKAFAILIAASWVVAAFEHYLSNTDLNMYFGEIQRAKAKFEESLPYDTLVVHAGPIDEALLALSSEPLVYGSLIPTIRSLMFPQFDARIGRISTGGKLSPRRALRALLRPILSIARYAFSIVTWPFLRAWEKFLTTQLLTIVTSPALGVSGTEFSGALLTAQHKINVPEAFREKEWDVTEMLLAAPPRSLPTTRELPYMRYSFLWDTKAKVTALGKSWLWKQIEPSIPDIRSKYAQFPQVDIAALEQRLATTSLVLQERLRELIGATGFMHSAYYSNPQITKEIAKFIVEYRGARKISVR